MKALAMFWTVWLLVVPANAGGPDAGADGPDASADAPFKFHGWLEAGRRITLASDSGGRVESVPVQVGQRVSAGDLLVELDDSPLTIAVERAELAVEGRRLQEASAATRVESAQKQFELVRELAEKSSVAQRELVNAERELESARFEQRLAQVETEQAALALKAARHKLDATRVLAPFDGTISRIDVQPAEQVAASQRLVELIDASRLTAHVDLPLRAVLRLRGRAAEAAVLVTAQGASAQGADAEVRGQLVSIAPVLDPVNGCARAVVAIDGESAETLFPGQNVTIRIEPGSDE